MKNEVFGDMFIITVYCICTHEHPFFYQPAKKFVGESETCFFNSHSKKSSTWERCAEANFGFVTITEPATW